MQSSTCKAEHDPSELRFKRSNFLNATQNPNSVPIFFDWSITLKPSVHGVFPSTPTRTGDAFDRYAGNARKSKHHYA
jgi:hypothetical protein